MANATAKELELDKRIGKVMAGLDRVISTGNRITIDGLPTGYVRNLTPFLGPLSPSQVKVEK